MLLTWASTFPVPSLDLDILNASNSKITFTRSGTTATRFNELGNLESVAANTPRFDYDPVTLLAKGWLIEPSRVNVVLWNRDLTNAAWTKSNATATKNQAGIDGVSNSASSLAATAGNATCLQSITLGSSARFQSTYIKRLVGSGVVEMTTDNGSTWTAVTVTAAWTKVTIPTQTLANPTVGYRIVTNGDSVAIDCVQNETGSCATSPILTTTASATRNAELALITDLNWYNVEGGTFYSEFQAEGLGTGLNHFATYLNDNSYNNALTVGFNGSNLISNSSVSGSVTLNPTGTPARSTNAVRVATRFQANNCNMAVNGTACTVDSSGAIPTGLTRFQIGTDHFSANNLTGWIKRIKYFPAFLNDAQLVALTA